MAAHRFRFLFSTAALCTVLCAVAAPRLLPVGEGWARNTINTTVFRNNALVTHLETQYIAYYDAEQYVVLGKRRSGSSRWTLQRTPFKGRCNDAHNVISIMLDGDGYVHVAWDHHGDTLRYARGKTPGSLDLGSPENMTGRNEDNVTYPEFYRLPGGNLLFVYRAGGSGNGNMVMNRYDLKARRWVRVQEVLIDGERQRNAYWQLCVDPLGGIHCSWVWRETSDVATNHDLCYAYSPDEGRTWKRSDGSTYTLPIRAANAEYIWRIPQKSELINQTSMTCDDRGMPYIATYWRPEGTNVPQYFLVYFDGSTWHASQVSQRTTPFSLSGAGTKKIPIARPRVVVSRRGKHISIGYIFRDVERGSRVSVYSTSSLASGQWQVTDLTGFPVDSWEPTYDTELWQRKKILNIFVQRSGQGDGETLTDLPPQQVYVLQPARRYSGISRI